MDLQADINWIREEIRLVEDPDLIEAFKRMLQFRKKVQAQTIEEYNRDIELAEEDIKAGRVFTQKEVEERAKKW